MSFQDCRRGIGGIPRYSSWMASPSTNRTLVPLWSSQLRVILWGWHRTGLHRLPRRWDSCLSPLSGYRRSSLPWVEYHYHDFSTAMWKSWTARRILTAAGAHSLISGSSTCSKFVRGLSSSVPLASWGCTYLSKGHRRHSAGLSKSERGCSELSHSNYFLRQRWN